MRFSHLLRFPFAKTEAEAYEMVLGWVEREKKVFFGE